MFLLYETTPKASKLYTMAVNMAAVTACRLFTDIIYQAYNMSITT